MAPQVIVPYVRGIARVAALDAIHTQWPGAHFVELPVDDHTAQARVIWTAFQSGRPFAIVAHDVIPPPGAFDSLFACGRSWCGYRVPLGAEPKPMTLSLDAFAGDVGRDHAAAIDQALHEARNRLQWRSWATLDVELANRLQIKGLEWHEHEGEVEHLHDYAQVETALGPRGPEES